MFNGKATILSLQQFPLILQYGDLPLILVTKIGDAVDMRWYYPADFHSPRPCTSRTRFIARQELEHLEKETVTVLKRAVLADIRGDPHGSQHLRRKARNLEKAKPPAFLADFEDNSPPICKAYFDLLIGLDNELTELNAKSLKLAYTESDQHLLLIAKHIEVLARFEGIIQGMVQRLIPGDMWFEPLAEFFRRVEPKMMGCDSCFDPLNIVPQEWRVPTRITNFVHLRMLTLHWRHASFVPREQPQFLDGTEPDNLPTLLFDINSSQWKLIAPDFMETLSRKWPIPIVKPI